MQDKKQIIFLEAFSTSMMGKISKSFKERGYKTISVRILKSEELADKKNKDFFNKIIRFNLKSEKLNFKNSLLILKNIIYSSIDTIRAIIEIKKLKPYVIFVRAAPSWPCALTKIMFKKIPLIYFPYDIRSQLFPTKKLAKERRGISGFEVKAERFCFEHSDGIMHKGDPEELKYLNGRMLGDGIKICSSQISFLPYCSKEDIIPLNKNKLSKVDKNIHFVHIGTVSPENSPHLLEYFQKITEQKMHVHLYLKSTNLPGEKIVKSFERSWKNEINFRYFHVYPPLKLRDLIKEISKCDFGLWFPNHKSKNFSYTIEPKFCAGNRIPTYICAGIPFFYSSRFEFVDKLMQKYGLNCPIENPDGLGKKLKEIKKINYKKFEKNILKMRNDFLFEKEFPRLEKFVKEVVERKERN